MIALDKHNGKLRIEKNGAYLHLTYEELELLFHAAHRMHCEEQPAHSRLVGGDLDSSIGY